MTDREAVPSFRPRLETLVGASLRIHAEHRLEAVLQRVADSAREVTGARYAALGVLNGPRSALASFVTSGLDPETKTRIGALPEGHGILGLLITDPYPLRLKDISKHPSAHGFPPHHPPMKSFLGVPIMGREGVFGNLYLTDKQGAAEFGPEDEAVTLMLAAQAAVAIDNARLHEESARLIAEVRDMQASRDRFFAMINHELRNALTAVYGWADLLVRRAGDQAPKAALEVYQSAERTLGLLNDLLDLSRLEASRLKLAVTHCDARQLVHEAVVSLEPIGRSRGVPITFRASPGKSPWRRTPSASARS